MLNMDLGFTFLLNKNMFAYVYSLVYIQMRTF